MCNIVARWGGEFSILMLRKLEVGKYGLYIAMST